MARIELELRHYKTKNAAQNNAIKLTKELADYKLEGTFIAVQLPSGWWTGEKVTA